MGAWEHYFKLGDKGGMDRIGWSILAIKAEVVYNGITQGGLEMSTPEYGTGTDKKVKEFQKLKGLEVDGVVGPKTAHALWKKRAFIVEAKYQIPSHMLCRLKVLESDDDPACVGDVDPRDRGLMQINSFYHPNVTDQLAFNPAYSIDWSGQYLLGNYKILNDWILALAAYNVGTAAARKWGQAGKPETNPDGSPNTAAQYVRVVLSRTC